MFPEKLVESKWDTIFWVFQRNFSGSNGTSEKVVPFLRTECSKQKFVFNFLKAIFNLRPSLSFFGNGTDLYKW